MNKVTVKPPYIKLDQFLKLSGAADTGGIAKQVISEGLVKVNGEVCLMRGKKLHGGEKVEFEGQEYICVVEEL